MIIVDTSALAKIMVEEKESPALRGELQTLSDRGEQFSISTLAVTELRRLAIRLGISAELIDPVVRPFRTLRLTEAVLQLAGRLAHKQLGTLDAIHIATGLITEAQSIITYDAEQAKAALLEGINVLQPGN